jgi:hypothetical protein
MSITATSRVSPTTSHPMRRAGDMVIERETVQDDARAITPTEPVSRPIPASLRSVRPDASFITHLIATAEQVPQTRTLRRAEIVDVEAAYRKAAGVYGMSVQSNQLSRTA